MGRSIKSRLAMAFVVTAAALASFAGTAGASGISSGNSVASIFNSPVGGTCVADDFTPAGSVARGSAASFWPDYSYFPYVCGGGG